MKTAKEQLKSFLEAWKKYDYKSMFSLCQKTWTGDYKKNDLKNIFPKRIKSYSIVSEFEYMPTVIDIVVKVRISGQDKKLTCRLICELEPYNPSIDGHWGVNPLSVIRNIN